MSDGGIDLTPLYRAAAKGQMIQGAISLACGIVIALVASRGLQIAAFVLIVAGVVRLAYGIYRYQKYS